MTPPTRQPDRAEQGEPQPMPEGVVKFRVAGDPLAARPREEVYVHEAIQRDGTRLWKVQNGLDSVLNADGWFEWEPQPSSRDDDFIARTRFPTFADALARAREWVTLENPLPAERPASGGSGQ
jgi:hypothetical protein